MFLQAESIALYEFGYTWWKCWITEFASTLARQPDSVPYLSTASQITIERCLNQSLAPWASLNSSWCTRITSRSANWGLLYSFIFHSSYFIMHFGGPVLWLSLFLFVFLFLGHNLDFLSHEVLVLHTNAQNPSKRNSVPEAMAYSGSIRRVTLSTVINWPGSDWGLRDFHMRNYVGHCGSILHSCLEIAQSTIKYHSQFPWSRSLKQLANNSTKHMKLISHPRLPRCVP